MLLSRYTSLLKTKFVIILILALILMGSTLYNLRTAYKTNIHFLKTAKVQLTPGDSPISKGILSFSTSTSPVEATSSKPNLTVKHCSIYDSKVKEVPSDFVKNLLKTPSGNVPIYTYSDKDLISRRIRQYGSWELDIIQEVDTIMKSDPEIHMLDLGANLGVYTFAAARRGRRVIALDANLANIHRLRLGVLENNFEDRVVLLHNALSDSRDLVYMHIIPDNIGGSSVVEKNTTRATINSQVKAILMDDLLEVTGTIKKAVMKFDIELKEFEALHHADRLFREIDIKLVMMEWSIPMLKDVTKAMFISFFFRSRGYKAYKSPASHDELLDSNIMHWVRDMVWRKV